VTINEAMQRARAALHASDWIAARQLLNAVLAVEPRHFDALHLLGYTAIQEGRPEEAVRPLTTAEAINPRNAELLNNLGIALAGSGRHTEAVAAYDRAAGLAADHAQAWFNRGNSLSALAQPEAAIASYGHALEANPGFGDALINLGNVLVDLKRTDEALAAYDRALALGDDAQAHYNRANVLRDRERHDEALAGYERAVALAPNYVDAWNNRGVVLRLRGRAAEAVQSYDRALALRSDAGIHNNRGNALRDLHRFTDALAAFDAATALNPNLADAWNNRGNVLRDLERDDEALACYDRALALQPTAAFQVGRGNLLRDRRRHADALASYAQALELDPGWPWLFGTWLHAKMKVCDWNGVEAGLATLREKVDAGEKASLPFSFLTAVAHNHASAAAIAAPLPPRRADADRIHLGYFSADFHEHPMPQLMAGLFEAHDRGRFRVTAFSFGPDQRDAMRGRLVEAFDEFIDVRALSDAQVVALARERGVDIAIDLKGYTQDNRAGIFALRAAPVQVNYLGYPGTMGAACIDYVLADAVVIPDAGRAHWSERIARLPDSYLVIAESTPSRAEAGLPEPGFVFCCFNGNYKITPAMFDAWVRILQATEGSVLWLLEENPWAAQNLRREAAARGLARERLVFAPRVPMAEHLARHRLADLFLDTLPCNAHTTACDALWAGLPVLTCPGESFVSRVAASCVLAIGMPELVAASLPEYEKRAIELASDQGELQRLRTSLQERRMQAPLFDTRRSTRHFESAYATMHARHLAGLEPIDFHVAALNSVT